MVSKLKVKKLDKLPRGRLTKKVLEGVDLVGYHEESDSFVVKHPMSDVFWIVSRGFINELSGYQAKAREDGK